MAGYGRLLLGALWCAVQTGLAAAQPVSNPAFARPGAHVRTWPGSPGHSAIPQQAGPLPPGAAFVASAILPGAGQFMLDEERWVPFAVLEAWGWITFFTNHGRSRDDAGRYRDLAWEVARRVSVGERRDTVFEYYETLSHWSTSGAFDADPEAPGIQPEPDGQTYNGDVWRLARSLLIPGGGNAPPGSPAHERALAYYMEHAIPAGYAWAWGPFGLEQERFRELIRSSDEAARAATLRLGMILANHMVSAVDALILARLREAVGADGGPAVHLHAEFAGAGPHARWSAALRLVW